MHQPKSQIHLSQGHTMQQYRASARSLQELKVRSLFAVAQGKDRVKAIQHLQVLPCLIFFLPFRRLFHMPPKMSYIFLLLHRVSLLNHSLLPPLLRNLFFSLHGFFNLKDVCATKKKKKKILPLCSFFYTSFLLSGWRDLGFSKCQNPLSGWLSDQAPPWSWSPCQAFPHLANSPFELSLEKLACPRQQLSLCPTELHLTG